MSKGMMDDSVFWLSVWGLVSIVVCVVTYFVMMGSTARIAEMADLVREGKDPLAVRCMYSVIDNDQVCLSYVLTTGKAVDQSIPSGD